jgi:hypothetical protein
VPVKVEKNKGRPVEFAAPKKSSEGQNNLQKYTCLFNRQSSIKSGEVRVAPALALKYRPECVRAQKKATPLEGWPT